MGLAPYGQHNRYEPSAVHQRFNGATSFPFVSGLPANMDAARYQTNDEYNNIFQSTQFEHWQHHAGLYVEKSTCVPGPLSSMYAGVNDV